MLANYPALVKLTRKSNLAEKRVKVIALETPERMTPHIMGLKYGAVQDSSAARMVTELETEDEKIRPCLKLSTNQRDTDGHRARTIYFSQSGQQLHRLVPPKKATAFDPGSKAGRQQAPVQNWRALTYDYTYRLLNRAAFRKTDLLSTKYPPLISPPQLPNLKQPDASDTPHVKSADREPSPGSPRSPKPASADDGKVPKQKTLVDSSNAGYRWRTIERDGLDIAKWPEDMRKRQDGRELDERGDHM